MKPCFTIATGVDVNGPDRPEFIGGLQIHRTKSEPTVRSFTNVLNLLLLLLGLAPTAFTQTSIVAARTATEVILGTDSLSRLGTLQGPKTLTSSCKIYSCGTFYVAMAGPVENFAVGNARFDAISLLRDACQIPGDSKTKLESIERAFLAPYTEALRETKRLKPSYYITASKTHELYVNIIMVGFENGSPFIAGIDLTQPALINTPIEVIPAKFRWYAPLPPKKLDWTAGGHTASIDGFKNNGKIWTAGPIEGVRFLIMQEIAAEPDHVGPPIDILRITKDGPEWICQKPECDSKKKGKPCPQQQPR